MNPIPDFCQNGLCDVRQDEVCRNCWARLDGDMACDFIVRMVSPQQPAVSFYSNACFARVFCVVPDAKATRFATVAAARRRMREHGLRDHQARIVRGAGQPVSQPKPTTACV